jgi:type IV pilus assembly protein PilE
MKTIMRGNQGGFTLMELMIVVAIVAILLLIALPSYQNQIIRGNRTAAQSEMLDIANREQQFLLANRAFADKATLAYSLPTEISTNYDYDITVGLATIPSFTITFTPVAGGRQAGDGALTLDNRGAKTPAAKW